MNQLQESTTIIVTSYSQIGSGATAINSFANFLSPLEKILFTATRVMAWLIHFNKYFGLMEYFSDFIDLHLEKLRG